MVMGKLTKKIETISYPKDAPRDYIGASSIGSDCLRQVWYEYNNAPSSPIPNKTRRTWDIGKILEGYVLTLLRQAGFKITEAQSHFIDPEFNYFQGHCDGMLLNPLTLLEIKTAKDASYKLFIKHGCKQWNFKYYCQLQTYMGISGIHEAYIIVLNKDTSEINDELVKFDPVLFEKLRQKATTIHKTKIPPPRINANPTWFLCKMCKYRGICHS